MARYEINLTTGEFTEHPDIQVSSEYISFSVCSCTPWQIRKALIALGLREQVELMIKTSDDINLKDGWEFATEFRSDDPFVISMGTALGKTEKETAELIAYASTL